MPLIIIVLDRLSERVDDFGQVVIASERQFGFMALRILNPGQVMVGVIVEELDCTVVIVDSFCQQSVLVVQLNPIAVGVGRQGEHPGFGPCGPQRIAGYFPENKGGSPLPIGDYDGTVSVLDNALLRAGQSRQCARTAGALKFGDRSGRVHFEQVAALAKQENIVGVAPTKAHDGVQGSHLAIGIVTCVIE